MCRIALIRTLALALAAVAGLLAQMSILALPPKLTNTKSDVVILAQSQDPYYPLAQEIARQEGAPLLETVQEAATLRPTFLLWVASPAHLSDQALAKVAQTLQRQSPVTACGLICGSTIAAARALYQRAAQVREGAVYAANGEFPTAGVDEPRLIAVREGSRTIQALTPESLLDALKQASYVSFTGHGGRSYLRLDEEVAFTPDNLAKLPPVVVSTASCSTFRPWEKRSIALAFADHGAAAYAGFTNSPNEGYLLGEFEDLPFRYSRSDFTVGQIARVQARGTLQGFALFPYYWLLGDPRIALQKAAPYRITADSETGGVRTITLSDVPAGVVPVRIAGGAPYRFVEIEGVGETWEGDPFYNAHLQALPLDADRLLLAVTQGGNLTLHLRREPPFYWLPVRLATAALDHVLLFAGTPWPIALVALLPTAWRLLRQRIWRPLLPALAAAGMLTGLYLLYAGLRLPLVTINSKPMGLRPEWVAAFFVSVASGAYLYLSARRAVGREVGILVAAAPALLVTAFCFGVIAFINTLSASETGVRIYNHAAGTLALLTLLMEVLLFQATFALTRRLGSGFLGGQEVGQK